MKLLIFAFLCALTIGAWDARVSAATRPNILFILVDDQSPFDLKLYNSDSTLETPNIDKLASRGMVFDGAYHMGAFVGAVCTPSRHMIMSGRTLWHLPIAPWGSKTCPPELEQQTIPAVFNRAGYATMRTCKIGNSYEAANRLFTVRKDASKRGPTDETGSPWHGDQVMDFLEKRDTEKDSKPFLIYFGFSHPHDTRDGPPRLLSKYGATNHTDKEIPPPRHAKQPPLPKNYLAAHPFETTHSDVRDEIAVSGVWERRDEASIRNEIGRQYACSENIDIQIGRVLAKLEAMGELDNTYVFYTADHGMSIGRHGLMGKQNLYQHTWRVPFIAAGPTVKKGLRVEGNVYLLDVLPTLCDLTGTPIPSTNEGISFRKILEGRETSNREVMYGAYSGGGRPGMRCVKKGDWKLIEYESADRHVQKTQLFNLKENPHELISEHHTADTVRLTNSNPRAHETDLSDDPQYAEQLKDLRHLLLTEMRRLDDPFRFSFQPDDGLPGVPQSSPKAKKKAR